jgi:DNA polymerase III delta subunit
VTSEAAKRLLEIVGVDLRLMDNEIDKLAVYVGDKKTIDLDDVNQASAWVREYDAFELGNALETADLRECLLVLDKSFKTGEKPEMILFRFVSYFRDILLARILLEDESADRKAIFKRIKPQISESYGDFFQRKYAAFFGVVEGLSAAEFAGLLGALERVDVAIKTTEVPPKTAFEAFLFEYCRLRKKKKPISRAWA